MFPQVDSQRHHLDDTVYDASEEESEVELDMETATALENPVPILDTPQQRTVREPTTRKILRGRHLAAVVAGYSTSDDEFAEGAVRRHVRPKRKRPLRRASWPESPASPKTAHDSGVQGLDDAASGSGGWQEKARKQKRRSRHYVLMPARDGEWTVTFQGIAEADVTEEQWKQIILEEHMDKIFNALTPPVNEGILKTEDDVVDEETRESIKAREVRRPEGKKTRLRDRITSLIRLFGCGRIKREKEWEEEWEWE